MHVLTSLTSVPCCGPLSFDNGVRHREIRSDMTQMPGKARRPCEQVALPPHAQPDPWRCENMRTCGCHGNAMCGNLHCSHTIIEHQGARNRECKGSEERKLTAVHGTRLESTHTHGKPRTYTKDGERGIRETPRNSKDATTII